MSINRTIAQLVAVATIVSMPGISTTILAKENLPAALSSASVRAELDGATLLLTPKPNAIQARKFTIPRLCSPIRSIQWLEESDVAIKFWPEPDEWVFSWKKDPSGSRVIKVELDQTPVLLPDCPISEPAGDSSIILHACQASTFGEKLRFEPQWYKNTVGYWTIPTDYATWKLVVGQEGTYSVAVLQGCGAGRGGSDATITLRAIKQAEAGQGSSASAIKLAFQTVDTGHFQNFRWNHLGFVQIPSTGTYELRIQPDRIAKGALFDVRTIHLVRQAQSPVGSD